jgi:hypothetical protein
LGIIFGFAQGCLLIIRELTILGNSSRSKIQVENLFQGVHIPGGSCVQTINLAYHAFVAGRKRDDGNKN